MSIPKTRADLERDSRLQLEFNSLLAGKTFASGYETGKFIISLGRNDVDTSHFLTLVRFENETDFQKLWVEYRSIEKRKEAISKLTQLCLDKVGFGIYISDNWDRLGKSFIRLHTPPTLDKEAVLKFATESIPSDLNVAPDEFLQAVERTKKWQEEFIFGEYNARRFWSAVKFLLSAGLLVIGVCLVFTKPILIVGLFALGMLIKWLF